MYEEEMPKMNIKKATRLLEEKNYDEFGEDLYAELEYFGRFETIDEMVEDQGAFNIARFLTEDFPSRYEF